MKWTSNESVLNPPKKGRQIISPELFELIICFNHESQLEHPAPVSHSSRAREPHGTVTL
jgi:hypothetical protein